jgi:iron-sulfur cluster repair protein YtfE (RIC family)
VTTKISTSTRDDLLVQPIRALTERYPALLPLLTRYGIDTCCGSVRTIPEAAALHGFNADDLIGDALDLLATP